MIFKIIKNSFFRLKYHNYDHKLCLDASINFGLIISPKNISIDPINDFTNDAILHSWQYSTACVVVSRSGADVPKFGSVWTKTSPSFGSSIMLNRSIYFNKPEGLFSLIFSTQQYCWSWQYSHVIEKRGHLETCNIVHV